MTNVYEKVNVGLPEEETVVLAQIKDDLTKIKGVGPGTAEKLNVRKIYTYRQLAEITPEKLSEAPGIGVATASKIIEEAKRLLGGIQEENKVKVPEQSKEEHIIAKESKKEVLVHAETEVKEGIEFNEPIQQRSVTPYEKLLARSDDKVEKAIPEPEEIETETKTDNLETFEVAEVNVEEELLQEIQVEEEPIENVQKPWFSEKFNRSRLTASHPAVLERRSKESKAEIEEIEEIETETKPEVEEIEEVEIEEVEEYQEEIPEPFENNATVEPFESEAPFLEEAIPREEIFNVPLYNEPEVQKVPEVPEIIEVPETIEIPTKPRVPDRREELTIELAESLKELGYYAIPRGIEALSPFFQSVDYIGLKLVSVSVNSKLIVLVPIKLCDLEGTILIHEDKIDYKAYSKSQGSNLVLTARQYADDLLKAKDAMFEDVVSGKNFQEFFEKYLQVRFRAEKSAKNKKLYFVSGQTQYKVLIEPILLTKIEAKCMEKTIL